MLPVVEKTCGLRALILICTALLVACSAADEPGVSPTATARERADVDADRWYSDAEKEAADPEGEQRWVAAWFAGEDAMPESMSRWWKVVDPAEEQTAEALLARSVALLDDPPEDQTSAFARGITVHHARFNGSEVRLDLDAASPGLYGHGSAGYVIGSEQLASAAAFYFPEADTLCVAYDGERTAIEEGGPSFLHDASGCPIPLR